MLVYLLGSGILYYTYKKIYNYLSASKSLSYNFLYRFLNKEKNNYTDEVLFEKIKEEVKKRNVSWPFMKKFQFDTDNKYVVINGEKKICLSSYAYLNLQYDEEIKLNVLKQMKKYSTGNIGPRMLSGNLTIYSDLEEKISNYYGYEKTMLCSSGYMACMSSIIGMVEKGDALIMDSKSHDSLLSGAKLSGATIFTFKHNDIKSLRYQLNKAYYSIHKKILVVVESIYSMDGDICNYPEIQKEAEKFNAKILLDEAHGLGVLGNSGRGIIELYPDLPKPDLICGTFSKTIASVGGFITSNREIINLMHYSTPGNMFTAPISVYNTCVAIESFNKLLNNSLTDRITQLHEKYYFLKNKLLEKNFNIGKTEICIIPLIFQAKSKKVKDLYHVNFNCLKLSEMMFDEGFWITPVIFPACPLFKPRIRLMARYDISEELLNDFVEKLEKNSKNLNLL